MERDYFAELYDEYEGEKAPLTLYLLLDNAELFINKYLENKDENRLDVLFKWFADKCQWAKEWLRKEHGENPVVSADAKSAYLKDWTDYINKIYQWIQTAIQKGKADEWEYQQLQNTRDGLFTRGAIFYQASAIYNESKLKQLKEKIASLKIQADLASTKQNAKKAKSQTLNEVTPNLTDTENNIVEALSKDVMTGEKLAEKAGYPHNSNFKSTLSSLRKRGILGNKAPGYFLEPKYHFLLSKSDQSQDKRQD